MALTVIILFNFGGRGAGAMLCQQVRETSFLTKQSWCAILVVLCQH